MSAPASFRDPDGRLILEPDRAVRWVQPEAAATLRRFLGSRAHARWHASGNLVSTRPAVAPPPAPSGLPPDALVVEHQRVSFASYPHEWPPSLLARAGRLTLDLHESLVAEGLGLKDATPANILFEGTRPMFIDVLSVEARPPHDPFWRPYAQFARTFLIPLRLWRDLAIPPNETLLVAPDGPSPEVAIKRYGPVRRLGPGVAGLITVPALLGRTKRANTVAAPSEGTVPEKASFIHRGLMRGLRRRLRRLDQARRGGSAWTTYDEGRCHYPPAAATRKDAFVEDVLGRVRPPWVLDLGCNTGRYAHAAARSGARVVACDADAAVVDALARGLPEDERILPLVVDLSRPTPALGWRNAETTSFLDRARGRFDMVLALGLLHHLIVGARVPMVDILGQWAEFTRDGLLVEFVGSHDPMFVRLARGREHLHAGHTQSAFAEAVREAGLRVEAAEALPGMDRSLYHLRRT